MANEIDADALSAHFAEQDARANAVSGVSLAVKAGAQFTPEEWAKSSKLSASTGVDPSALASNPLIRAAAENRLKGDALNVPELVDTHPKVAQWMVDPVNAGITGENHGLMQDVSDAFDQLSASAYSGGVNLVGAGAKLLQAGTEMVGIGTSDSEAATLYKNDPEGLKRFREESMAGGLSRFARKTQAFSTEVFGLRDPSTKAKYDPLKYATLSADESALLSPVKVIGDVLRSLPTSVAMGATFLFTRNVALVARTEATAQAATLGLTGEAAGAFVSKAVTAAAAKAAAVSGAVSEGAAGYATQALSTEEEAAKMDMSKSARYAQLIEDGYAPEAAKAKIVADVAEQAGVIAGLADAAVNAAAGRLLGGILTAPGGALKTAGKTAALEGATEAVQSPLEQLGTNIGLVEIDPSKNLTDGLLESMVQGLAVGAASGGMMGALHGLTSKGIADDAKVRSALAGRDALTRLSEAAAKAAPVRDLDKGRFKEFMQSMVEDSDLKELFVDANALHDALAQAPIEAQQMFAQEMPEVISQLGEGTATDGFVRIPVADYAAHIAGTDLDTTILPQLKTDVTGLTYSQAEQQMQSQQADMQKTADELVTKRAEDAAYQADVKGVYDNILGQLEAAKRFRPDVNKKYAELQKAYFVVAAEEEGVTPSEMLRRFPLKTVGGDTLGDVATTLEQREQPLRGLPTQVEVDGKQVTFGPVRAARDAAQRYADQAGIDYAPPVNYVKVDPKRAARVAAAYEAMPHTPNDPEVKAAYDALIKETLAQWEAIKKTGLKVEFIEGADPYGNPRNAILDVADNNHLWVYPTEAGFGGTATADVDVSGNPLFEIVEGEKISGKPVRANDIFRIVHDYFGHVKEGVGFRADGEENAWRMHSAMFSPLAQRALTTETRGQNSWVNFGPYAEHNKTATGETTQYAPQKTGLLPEWVSSEGVVDEAPTSSGYGYRMRDAARKATLRSFAPEQVKDLLRKTDWAILTAENPAAQQLTPEENAARMVELKADLAAQGIEFEVVEGKYGGNVENSVMLVGVTQEQASAIGQKFGQESVLTRAGLVYPDGTVNPAKKVNSYKKAPDDFYTKVPSTGALFSVDIDFDQKLAPAGARVGEVEIAATHFSREVRTNISGRAYGTGIRGAEARRLAESYDSRIKSRISFYVDEGKGVFPEGGVGAFKHELTLTNMYDGAKNPLRLDASDSNTFEAAVLDAGFDGYYIREGFGRQGVAVLMGPAADNVQVDLPPESTYQQSALQEASKRRGPDSAEVDPDAAWADQYRKKAAELGLTTPQIERLMQKGDRDPLTGLYADTELLPALRRAQASNMAYTYVESDTFNLSGMNAYLGANVRTDAVLEQIGKAYSKAFEGALTFRRGAGRFAALVPAGFSIADAKQQAAESVRRIVEQNGLADIKAPKTPGAKGVGLYSADAQVEKGAHPEEIIGAVQSGIKAAMPQEVADVVGSQTLKTWIGQSTGQASRVAESINRISSQVGLSRRDSETQKSAALRALERATAPAVINAGKFLDPEDYQLQDYERLADRLGLTERQRAAFAPSTRRDTLTGFFTDTDLNPTIARAVALYKKDGTPSSLVVADVANLGAKNAAFGKEVADVLLRNMVNIAQEYAGKAGSVDVIPFRHGGDEVAFVVVGAEHAQVQEAMARATEEVQRYVNAVGVQGLPHAKYPGVSERAGSGIYVGVKEIHDESTLDEIRDAADAQVELAKKLPKPRVEGETPLASAPSGVLYQGAADITALKPLWFSALAKGVESASEKAFSSGEQVGKWLDANKGKLGIKDDEIYWSGIKDWLVAQGRVSKADVLAYMAQNGVKITEELKGGKAPEGYVKQEGDKWVSYSGDGKRFGSYGSEADALASLPRVNMYLDRPTKYKSQQLPGGAGYKELLLTLPEEDKNIEQWKVLRPDGHVDSTYDNEKSAQSRAGEIHGTVTPAPSLTVKTGFRAPHFDSTLNILAHIRFNERADTDGNKVLFLEEIQSDWGQKGKKEGFTQKPFPGVENLSVEKIEGKFFIKERNAQGQPIGLLGTGATLAEAETRARATWAAMGANVPLAPFVTDTKAWTALALKRMIRYAADNGFNKIAWTTGEQQAERYDLSKQINEVVYRADTHKLLAYDHQGSRVLEEANVPPEKLEEYIGKEAAEKLLKQPVNGMNNHVLEGQDLKVGGEGMKGYYDQIVPQVANDILKKVGGGKVENVGLAGRDQAQTAYSIRQEADGRWQIMEGERETQSPASWFSERVEAQKAADARNAVEARTGTKQQGFTLTPEMKAKVQEGQALFQPNRGSFNPNTLTTSLLKDADLSTFLHETGHAFLEMDMARASAPDAPQRVKDRMAETLRWFEVADMDAWNAMPLEQKRPHHEKFARGFEAYLLEGKAPSAELQSAFASFRSWLLHLYRSIMNLNVELTPEVRQVFDRMLATDSQIAAAEEARGYSELALKGLSDSEKEAYTAQGKAATEDSMVALETRSMRDMKWLSNAKSYALKKMQVQADSKRRAIHAEVTAEVMAEPINQARTWLRKGETADPITGELVKADKGFRLDNAELAELYPETMLARPDVSALRGMTMNNGLPLDVVADMFGFRSGDQLVRELINGEDAKTKIDGLTDSRMLEENGDLVDPRAVEEAANRAVHNEARARFIATGLKALTNSPLSSRQLAKAAANTAEEVIAAKRVRDLHPAQYSAAETKANREALKEVAKDPAKAQRAQRSALLNNRLAAASLDALEEVRKGVDHLNKVQKKAAQSSMRGEYLVQLNALLDRFDLRKGVTLKSLDLQRTPFAEWVQSEADRLSAVVPDIAGWIQTESNATHYKNLTMEEFRGVVDAVKSLELMARREEKQYQEIRGMKFAEERSAVLDRIREFHPEAFDLDGEPLGMSPKFVKNLGDAVADLGDKAAAEFLNAETIISLLEGGTFGVVNEALFGRMSNRMDWKAQRMQQVQEQLKPLFDAYSLKERYNFGRKDIAADIGMSLTRENALVVALLHGNAEGRERLSNYGWNLATQQNIVNLLDAKDVELAKGIWQLFDRDLWPELKQLNDRTRGKSPPKVEALPVSTNHGEVSGGYFRLKYDSNLDERVHRLDEGASVKELLGGGLGMSAKTSQGASTERKENVTLRPRLDLGVLAEAVTETVHDLAFREAVADTMRVLNDVKVQNTIKTAAGTPAYRALVSRVREIAAPPRNPAGFIEKTLSIARKNTIVTLMSGVGTALQNFTGLASAYSGDRIAPGRLTKEIALFYSPKMAERYQFAMDNSDYMKGRNSSFERDLQRQIKGLTVNADIMPEMGTWLVLMGVVDKGTSVPVWNAAFKEGMTRFSNDHKQAVDYADHTVRQTLGSGREIDISQIMGGHGGWGQLKKTFTMFQSYFNGQLGQLVRSGAINKKLAQTNPKLAVARFTRDFMLVYVLPMALTKMIFSPPDKEPEEWARNYIRSFAQYGMAMIPLWGSMMNSLWVAFDPTARNYGYKITPVESGVEGVVKGVKSVTEAAAGEGDDRDLKNIIMGVGFALGLPGKLVSDTVLGTKAFLEGEAGPLAIIQGPPKK